MNNILILLTLSKYSGFKKKNASKGKINRYKY